jgi:predicted Zn-dependent protease
LLPNYNHNSIPPAIVPVNDTIHIKGLGNFNSSSLDEAKNILESTFGVICVIKTPEKTKNNMYFDGGSKLEVNSVVKNLRQNNKIVLITNDLIFNIETGHSLKGYTNDGGKIMIIRKNDLRRTIIHEFGHSLGLDHCNKKTCVMGINNDNEDDGQFCNNCKLKLNLK